MNESITQLSIQTLLDGRARYVIPMYQRNYAWEEGEIAQLIQDVIDTLRQDANRDYYIGSLVVYRRGLGAATTFETIDGQQRLTTLSLLAAYLKKRQPQAMAWLEGPCIDFASRPHSSKTFAAIARAEHAQDPIEHMLPDDINPEILNGYHLIQKLMPRKLNENAVEPDAFLSFLLSRVQIMRVEVPADTDLNHYFEIMNNRGEQLEKHEVLKARLLKALEDLPDADASKACLHQVWEACANMEKYVQMGFTPDQRDRVFGKNDWGTLQIADFDALALALHDATEAKSTPVKRSLNDILAETSTSIDQTSTNTDDAPPERFNSVVTFPHFLLHVLRVETGLDVPLDDKRLLSTVEDHVFKAKDPAQRVKDFVFNMLRCKFLYDHYIIKREFFKERDGWSLKRLTCNTADDQKRRSRYVSTFGTDDRKESINHRILMLLSAFHVSAPTLVYKHWLSAALHYLFSTPRIEAKRYLEHLESVARAFVFDRFLADQPAAYYDMIYLHGGQCRTRPGSLTPEAMRSRLSFANIENNLVFNFLDYLLWRQYRNADARVEDYEFTFRSSVEHYYPRNPHTGFERLDSVTLDSFGNLCLISHSKNSRLSNFTPEAKNQYYKVNALDSIKQYLMMQTAPWDAAAIHSHEDAMIDILESSLGKSAY
jgi:hypothetical protein